MKKGLRRLVLSLRDLGVRGKNWQEGDRAGGDERGKEAIGEWRRPIAIG